MKKVFSLFILLTAIAFADRLDISINGNYAYFRARGPHPFVLLTQNVPVRYPECNLIVIYIPVHGLPPLEFRIGNGVHKTNHLFRPERI